MPIISFNISSSLKKFLKKMVSHKEYKNNSTVIRDALVRLMDEKDGDGMGEIGALEQAKTDLKDLLPKLTSSVLITLKIGLAKLDRKISRFEINYHDSIIHKSTFFHKDFKTITYILEDSMPSIQMFITELNAFEDLDSFRYTINEPGEN
jgi:Arc/MetJ-type ribon-helix-helix transcriptional regulator